MSTKISDIDLISNYYITEFCWAIFWSSETLTSHKINKKKIAFQSVWNECLLEAICLSPQLVRVPLLLLLMVVCWSNTIGSSLLFFSFSTILLFIIKSYRCLASLANVSEIFYTYFLCTSFLLLSATVEICIDNVIRDGKRFLYSKRSETLCLTKHWANRKMGPQIRVN